MRHKNIAKNTEETQKLLSEVLEIFSQIDLKIIDLHKCSSDDFLSLNGALKENYKKATLIIEKANTTYDKIGDSGNLSTIKLSKHLIIKLNYQLDSIGKKLDISLDYLESVLANLTMLPIPLNNFLQNLSVLKLVFSNIKLTNSFFDTQSSSFNKEESQKIEDAINKIKTDCQPVEEQISTFQTKIKAIYDSLFLFRSKKICILSKVLEKIFHDLDIIEKHNNNALESKEHITVLAKQCSDNIESIITNLQYHDIIRQKMEHVQKSHQMIIGNLNKIDNVNDADICEEKLLSYVVQIPQISEIQTAQLLHANNEFQHAIDQITGKMNEIGQNMRQTARIYNSLSTYKYQEEEVSLESIDHAFNNLNQEIEECSNSIEKISLEVAAIFNAILHLKESMTNLDLLDNSIENLVLDKINNNNLISSDSTETANQAQQLFKLYADNRFEKSKLKELVKQTIELLARVNVVTAQMYNSDKHGFIGLRSFSDKSYNNVINIKDVDKYINASNEIIQSNSLEIIQKNKDAVKEAKYYKYFEVSIDEIIQNFNKIRDIVINGKLADIKISDSANSLKQIEEYYTMKTERIVHNNTIASILDNRHTTIDKDEDNQGNDVEFF